MLWSPFFDERPPRPPVVKVLIDIICCCKHRKPTNIMKNSASKQKKICVCYNSCFSKACFSLSTAVSLPSFLWRKRIHEEIRILGKASPEGQQNYTNFARCAVLTGKNVAFFKTRHRLIEVKDWLWNRWLWVNQLSDWVTILCQCWDSQLRKFHFRFIWLGTTS